MRHPLHPHIPTHPLEPGATVEPVTTPMSEPIYCIETTLIRELPCVLPCINGDLKWLALSSCSPSHIVVVVVLLVLIFTINIILAPPHRLNNASIHGNSSYLRLSNRVKTHTCTCNYRVEIGGLGKRLGHAWQTHGGVAMSWHFCQGTQCGQTHPIGPSHANSCVIFLM